MNSTHEGIQWMTKQIMRMALITIVLAGIGAGLAMGGPMTAAGVSVKAGLVQHKVLAGSDGRVTVTLDLSAVDQPPSIDQPLCPVDMVVVLDRSGSMQGRKIDDARSAVDQLIDRLTSNDRLALVAYSDEAYTLSTLVPMDHHHRRQLSAAVARVTAEGSTNLGEGLALGIDQLRMTSTAGRTRKVILISDGLANRGITDPQGLGGMAANAFENQIAVTTVGVGLDFNELLMTSLADYGGGRYYFLEEPQILAQVFEQEFQHARQVAAAGMEIRVHLQSGQRLINAGGYPIQMQNNLALVRPGDLVAGQHRRLFLTFQVPTDRPEQITLNAIQIHCQRNGVAQTIAAAETLSVVCVKDPKAVTDSIDKEAWGALVVQEEFSQLKEEVAEALRKGDRSAAQTRIKAYETRNRDINAQVGGAAVVTRNLANEVPTLRQSVDDTFSGPPAAVATKQKQNAKALQYEGYQERRAK